MRDVVETSARLGLEVLTLYAFSVENWKRPKTEVSTLMGLLKRYLRMELDTLLKNNIRFQVIGRLEELPQDVQDELRRGDGAHPRPTRACCSTSPSTTAAGPRSSTPCAGWSRTSWRAARDPERDRRGRPLVATSTRPASPTPTC